MEEQAKTLTIQDFMDVQLRVGKILTCERVEKSKKLLVMKVDIGTEIRQIVAGLSQVFIPAEMIGRRVVVVANLKPAVLMGLESQGMILAADGPQPVPVAVAEGIPLGSRVR